MLNIKNKINKGFSIMFLVLLLSSCANEKNIMNHYYLSLSGESENWEVVSYKIEITPDTFSVGKGTIIAKNKTVSTDYFITVHAIIDNEDEIFHAKDLTGNNTNITQIDTGSLKGKVLFLDKNEKPIAFERISEIYLQIEWQDNNKQRKKEKINLYSEETFSSDYIGIYSNHSYYKNRVGEGD